MVRRAKPKKGKRKKKAAPAKKEEYEKVFAHIERRVEKTLNRLIEPAPKIEAPKIVPKKMKKLPLKKEAVQQAEELRSLLNIAKKRGVGALNRWGE